MSDNKDLGADSRLSQAEPSFTVSALTGFDPARKGDVFQARLNLITRRNYLSNSINAGAALQWLYDCGRGALNGSTYGDNYSGSELAKPYLEKARSAFAQQMFDHAVKLALADMEAGLAIATETRRAETTGSVEDEGADIAQEGDA